ncbi:MAG: quinoprotein dehydrogenase-associated SoxYZ-like carrier [Gammaproteobacteria bacterium]
MNLLRLCLCNAALSLALVLSAQEARAAGEQSEVDVWDSLLRPQYFAEREITTGKSIVELRIPLRAEDAGVVPVSVDAKIPQTAALSIRKLYVFVDKNPRPLAGRFHVTPEMGQADLALRLRINQFTKVRVVAELSDGTLHMDEGFTRASGGCSEPPPFLKLKEARERIGQMKFRTVQEGQDDSALGQLIISHPNITGLQLDQRTRAFIPAEYVTKVEIRFNGRHVMTAETDISVSEDPSFRFFFKPQQGGTLEARMTDSKGREFTRTFEVGAASPG